jgi:hypothetical protein
VRADILELFRRLDAKHAGPAEPDMKLIEAEPIGQAAKRVREESHA